jgi:hypothetical protein
MVPNNLLPLIAAGRSRTTGPDSFVLRKASLRENHARHCQHRNGNHCQNRFRQFAVLHLDFSKSFLLDLLKALQFPKKGSSQFYHFTGIINYKIDLTPILLDYPSNWGRFNLPPILHRLLMNILRGVQIGKISVEVDFGKVDSVARPYGMKRDY